MERKSGYAAQEGFYAPGRQIPYTEDTKKYGYRGRPVAEVNGHIPAAQEMDAGGDSGMQELPSRAATGQ